MVDKDFDLEQVQFKDIDEGFRFKILEFWLKANELYNSGKIREGFNYYKTIFYLIQPKEFKSKEVLKEYTQVIKEYLESLDNKPINMAQKIQLTKKSVEFEDLVDEYFQLIPDALDELGLYLKVIKRRDDWDESFSIESFNSNVSLLDSKREILCGLSSKDLVSFMSPVEVHNCHARIMLDLAIHKKFGE